MGRVASHVDGRQEHFCTAVFGLAAPRADEQVPRCAALRGAAPPQGGFACMLASGGFESDNQIEESAHLLCC